MEGTSKTIAALTIIGLVISATLLSSVTASIDSFPQLQEQCTIDISEDHPDFYEVTRYEYKGLVYDKETIRISYDDAIAIKDAFNSIDSSLEDAKYKAEWKREILVENGLLSEERDFGIINSLIRKKTVQSEDDVDEVFGLFLTLTGTLGPGLNIGSFFVFSPAFTGQFQGANIHGSIYLTYNISVVTDKEVNITLIGWGGTLLVFPFITPFGYLDGSAIMGGYSIN